MQGVLRIISEWSRSVVVYFLIFYNFFIRQKSCAKFAARGNASVSLQRDETRFIGLIDIEAKKVIHTSRDTRYGISVPEISPESILWQETVRKDIGADERSEELFKSPSHTGGLCQRWTSPSWTVTISFGIKGICRCGRRKHANNRQIHRKFIEKRNHLCPDFQSCLPASKNKNARTKTLFYRVPFLFISLWN